MIDYVSFFFDSVVWLCKVVIIEVVCCEMVEFVVCLGFDWVIVCSFFFCFDEDELIDELFFVYGDWVEGCSVQECDVYFLYCLVIWYIFELDELFFWLKSFLEDFECMIYCIVCGVCDFGQVNGMQVLVFGCNGLEGVVFFVGEWLDLNVGCKFVVQVFCLILFFVLKCLCGFVLVGDV